MSKNFRADLSTLLCVANPITLLKKVHNFPFNKIEKCNPIKDIQTESPIY